MEALCAGCRVSVIGPRHAGETSERQRWIPDAQGATRAVFVAAGMGRLAFRGEARRVPARLCAARGPRALGAALFLLPRRGLRGKSRPYEKPARRGTSIGRAWRARGWGLGGSTGASHGAPWVRVFRVQSKMHMSRQKQRPFLTAATVLGQKPKTRWLSKPGKRPVPGHQTVCVGRPTPHARGRPLCRGIPVQPD